MKSLAIHTSVFFVRLVTLVHISRLCCFPPLGTRLWSRQFYSFQVVSPFCQCTYGHFFAAFPISCRLYELAVCQGLIPTIRSLRLINKPVVDLNVQYLLKVGGIDLPTYLESSGIYMFATSKEMAIASFFVEFLHALCIITCLVLQWRCWYFISIGVLASTYS